ncbi:uncharacterized protein LOC116020174 [Ipomoea triloba]|uniref:uncharacterized protein LOC116020174 n=1 Tax=Ipomoea triloba TaxID=35885 RepID=UPI00125DA400|nr:uncharacterized protein LOC116020174 [Ipomoea triloba]
MALDAKVKPMFIFLMETKVRQNHAERLKNKLCFEGLFYVDGGGLGGGLALLWRDKGVASLISYSKNHIDVQVRLPGYNAWRVTFYYGFPERGRRQQAWDFLRSLKHKSDLPWMVVGDFNDIASPEEKRGIHPHPTSLIDGFNSALEDYGLFYLGMRGRRFTWERGKGTENWVEERLDRAVVGVDWCSLFPHASVLNFEVLTSDHTAIFVELEATKIARRRRSFLFENAWLTENGCKETVLESWNASCGEWFPNRLDHCGMALKKWGGGFVKRVQSDIQNIQRRLTNLRDGGTLTHWLLKGDRNTKFYHLYASARKRKNRIQRLQDGTGQWVEGTDLLGVALNYFQNIFSTKGSHADGLLEDFVPKVTDMDNACLMQSFTVDEVKEALFSMAPDKSPGPDGFSPAFYQHFWNEISPDVANFIIGCANGAGFPTGMNDAIITLIPKKSVPVTMADLRPIALCNVTYKILSKMIANRLKGVLDHVVSPMQSAFIPGRLITDNVLVASEVIHYLNRKREGRDGWCALKLDMAKAYDKMEWPFLKEIMSRMGFHNGFIDLVMNCVTTVRYKVGVNGDLTDYIVPTCGLRQGDPLSPYLFILCAEGLSHLLLGAVRQGLVSQCSVARGAPGISHLFFADDSLLFFKATLQEAESVKSCLVKYERLSGQSVNFGKSCIVFSRNTMEPLRNSVAAVFNVQQSGNVGRYLGLPMGVGRNKREIFSYIEAKLQHRLGGWNKKVLSRAGKEILLKSVAQALPTYTMSIYFLPITMCTRLERMMNKFWWSSGSSNGGGIRWMAWERMCGPKAFGGLGFKSLHKFNLALLAKQGWRLLTKPNSLAARIYKARYFPKSDFLDANIGANPSFCWRSILAGQDVLRKGCYRRIGNGRSTFVWKQPWLPDDVNPFPISPSLGHDQNLQVSSLLHPQTYDWDIDRLNSIFVQRDVELIMRIPVSINFEDHWCWRGDLRGCYSVRHGYRMLSTPNEQDVAARGIWRVLWRLKIPPSVHNFLWRCVHNVLPTMTALHHRGVSVDILCPLCNDMPETIQHLFFECPLTASTWSDLTQPVNASSGFATWLEGVVVAGNMMTILRSVAICWSIWRRRNGLIWNSTPWHANNVPSEAVQLVNDWIGLQNEVVAAACLPQLGGASNMNEGMLRYYVDAAVFPNHDHVFYGVVILNCDGGFVADRNGFFRCMNNADLVEAMAIKEALSWAKDRGDMKILVLSDCQKVCKFINRSVVDLSYAGCVIEDCKAILRHFDVVSVCFVPRSANKLAHALARAAHSQSGPSVWISSIPPCLEPLI